MDNDGIDDAVTDPESGMKATRRSLIDPDRVAHARNHLPLTGQAAGLANLLSTMADPIRIRILCALDVSEELCVGDLPLVLEASEDQATYGLRALRTAGSWWPASMTGSSTTGSPKTFRNHFVSTTCARSSNLLVTLQNTTTEHLEIVRSG